jgi:hypothetical protein
MAMSTTSTPTPTPPMQPTPGVQATGEPTRHKPQFVVASVTEPVLFDDIDPVLLIRMYGAGNTDALKKQAMDAGHAQAEVAKKIIAAQQEPVVVPPAA